MDSIAATPLAAPLSDPLYYLRNFRSVLAWLAARYDDLLDAQEQAFLRAFAALPDASQGLLVRLIMRRGIHFRLQRLAYAELGDIRTAAAPLQALGWLRHDAPLDAATLASLLTREELMAVLGSRPDSPPPTALRRLRKPALTALLDEQHRHEARFEDWCHGSPRLADDTLLSLTLMPLCERLRLMFFGNLYQDWSTFVLTELGHHRFVPVPLHPEARAFRTRADIDIAAALSASRDTLAAEGSPEEAVAQLPPPPTLPWLRARHARLLCRLGQAFERRQQPARALACYAASDTPEARVRQVRALERLGQHRYALRLARQRLADLPDDETALQLQRIVPRLCRKTGDVRPPPTTDPDPPVQHITLPASTHTRVELAAALALATREPDSDVHYVENALLPGLFGLLCWPALFRPVPGAFFHPFQDGPADLRDPDFVARRRDDFAQCLAALDDGSYRDLILRRYREHAGLRNPFVIWPALSDTLLELALSCIPASHLRAVFQRLLRAPDRYRAGFPDLIQFWPAGQRYALIEIKGPGDRLQDHQQRWLTFFCQQGIPARVCHVQWAPSP
ncbi:VRR-NUC domain-containing protein [Isoalcanivorax indicus]|uniref:VRR-NUC domain-containing protein n=1 Tax=Isoalcanivorax indicus TaxID=2202653 RepID=UPI000DBA8E55|nr:VRR-NUC domain-containing protein [Isoalcanivorax indicus]